MREGWRTQREGRLLGGVALVLEGSRSMSCAEVDEPGARTLA